MNEQVPDGRTLDERLADNARHDVREHPTTPWDEPRVGEQGDERIEYRVSWREGTWERHRDYPTYEAALVQAGWLKGIAISGADYRDIRLSLRIAKKRETCE